MNKRISALILFVSVIGLTVFFTYPQWGEPEADPTNAKQPTLRISGDFQADTPHNSQIATTPDDADVVVSTSEPTHTIALRDLPLASRLPIDPILDREINPRLNLNAALDRPHTPLGIDPLLGIQADAIGRSRDRTFTAPLVNVEGQEFAFVNPPDTVGDIGQDHYVQIINAGSGAQVDIYDKSGISVLQGPVLLHDLAGGSGLCATTAGDGIVLYDELASRWLLTEFSDPGSGNAYCVYVSKTSDPTGEYYAYQFNTPNFPDYPKYAVWPDGYYVSSNEGTPPVYAMERERMLLGQAASMLRLSGTPLSGFGFQAYTPADLDGPPPPVGAPAYFARHRDDESHESSPVSGTDFIELWVLEADFDTPNNSTFTKLTDIPVSEFDSNLCGLVSFQCITQPGGSQLDPLREVIMWRLQYRNFDSHESLVGNLTTDVSGTDQGGIRWFELRKVGNGSWSLYQEGTYAPDGHSRWMGAIAMDASGNIALGYNVASNSVFPSLRYTGRLNGDTLGVMSQPETTMVSGAAANSSNRYGDYSSMSVDPVDGCTFWFTGQYNPTSSWSTRIAAFRFDECGGDGFNLSVSPLSQVACVDDDATYTARITPIGDFSETIDFSIVNEPNGLNYQFVPASIKPDGDPINSALTTSGFSAGVNTFEVVAMAASVTVTRSMELIGQESLTMQPQLLDPVDGATAIDRQPTFRWQALDGAETYKLEVATDREFSEIVYEVNGITANSHTVTDPLAADTYHYWRLTPTNSCGAGPVSVSLSFRTEPLPGACPAGTSPEQLLGTGFEGAGGAWQSSGSNSTWAITDVTAHTGNRSIFGEDIDVASDQRLTSSAISLPASASAISWQFWHTYLIEAADSGACYDGGLLEISTDGGNSWDKVPESALNVAYTGPIDAFFGNPLADEAAWCGSNGDWEQVIVDLTAYKGESAQLRYRLGTDESVGAEGWYIDDVLVQSCTSLQAGVAAVGSDPQTGKPGQELTYTVQLTNTGELNDTYDLLAISDWPVELSPTEQNIDIGESAISMVTVTIPLTASNNTTETIAITAISGFDLSVEVTVELVATVESAPADVALAGSEFVFGIAAETVTHTITIVNTGLSADTFTLELAGHEWPTELSSSSIALMPSESRTLTAVVMVPITATNGEYDTFRMTAVSGNDDSVSAELAVTTLVPYPLFMPLITSR